MKSYEQDSDVVRWGLQLFDGGPNFNSSYGDSMIGTEVNYCQGENFSDGVYVIESIHTNVDGITKHNLQGQLSQLNLEEMADSHMKNEETQLQNYSCDWIDQLENYNPGYACDAVSEEVRPSTSCCPCREPSTDAWICTLDAIDEYSLDCEVGKRLNQMNPVPHVPRINGEILLIDEATLDHQRLLDRLQLYQLVKLKVQGDGNCQLKSHGDIYEGYVPMEYDDYLEKMSKNGEWGDHVTLQAAADSYGVKVFVVTSFKDTCYIEILPTVQKSNRVICSSFWAEVHYNSIYPEGDTLPTQVKKKRPHLNEHGNHKALTAG